jgi:PadR family transcriptional regulator PadR
MLEPCILNAIRGQHPCGYDIAKPLRNIDGVVPTEGTVYPLLSRLKRDGLVATSIEESPQGPARKHYRVTPAGEVQLREMNRYRQTLKSGIDALKGASS